MFLILESGDFSVFMYEVMYEVAVFGGFSSFFNLCDDLTVVSICWIALALNDFPSLCIKFNNNIMANSAFTGFLVKKTIQEFPVRGELNYYDDLQKQNLILYIKKKLADLKCTTII